MFADAIRPREQIQNVGGRFEVEQKLRFVASDAAAVEDALAERGNLLAGGEVNVRGSHR
jgi:hypothetical protein